MAIRELIRAALSRPPKGEVGVSGTSTMASGGDILLTEEDYNPDLRGALFYKQIDRMRLSDSQVKAVMSILKLPLLAAEWGFEPASDDEKDIEIAEWTADAFFNGQQRTWDYVLRHMLLSLDFGVMPFEMVWDVVDDSILKRPMVHLTKLAPRMPSSIAEWYLTDDGQLSHVTQMAEKGGIFQVITIPGDRLLPFVHDMEGANYRGTSILRQARKDWYIKERLQRINQVAIEKRAAGIDVGTLPERASADQKAAFEAVLQTIRTHERAYVLEPEGHKYRVEGITGATLDPLASIQYADLMILRSILADFLIAGSGASGSYALVKDRSSFFLMMLGAIAKEIMSPINRDLIPRWVNWNWPNVTEYPTLEHSRLDRRDVGVIASALKDLIPVGVITPGDEIEQEVRDLLEMPDMPEGAELAKLAREDGDLIKGYRKAKAPKRPLEIKSISPSEWENQYAEGTPHWAIDMNPSLFAQEYVAELKKNKLCKLLEVGCGNGRDSIFFSRAGMNVTAIDVSPSAIELAESNAKQDGITNIRFKVGNVEKLSFADSEFEALFTLSVIHSTNLKKTIPEIARVVRKGGIVFVYLYADTEYVSGKIENHITVANFIKLLQESEFEILDLYSEQEKEFDEFGEKHNILVSLLRR